MARLCLVTPRSIDLASFPASLEAAVAAGDVASLTCRPPPTPTAAAPPII